MKYSIITLNKDLLVTEHTEGVSSSFPIVLKAANHKFLDCIHHEDAKYVRKALENSKILPEGELIRLRTSVSSYMPIYFIPIPDSMEVLLIDKED